MRDKDKEETKGAGKGRAFIGNENKQNDKRRAQLAKLSPGLRALLSAMLKSSLSLQQRQRSLEGVIFDVVVVKTETKFVDMMQEQGRAFAHKVEENRGKDEREEVGPPHLFVFAALLAGLLEDEAKIGQANKDLIESYQSKFEIMDLQEGADQILYCRLERCYKQEFKKVVLSIERSGVRSAVLSALTQLGGSRKQGRAPRGAQERDLEVWLQSLEG